MASEQRTRDRESRAARRTLHKAAVKASKDGTPTWVVNGRLSTERPSVARKAVAQKAAKKAAKAPANA
jgi:hypothetical protein